MARVLFVNVNEVLFARLTTTLESSGHQVISAFAQQTLDAVQEYNFDIVISFLDTLEALARFHIRYPQVPIIIISDRPTIQEAVAVMQAGAADYVANHQLTTQQIVERVNQLLEAQQLWARQLTRLQEASGILQAIVDEAQRDPILYNTVSRLPSALDRYPIQVKDLVIDPERRVVNYRDNIIKLSPTEFEILTQLAQAPNQVMSFEELASKLRGVPMQRTQARRMLTAHMSNLRSKLESVNCNYLMNKRGTGYYLNVQDGSEPNWGFSQLQWLAENTLDVVILLEGNQRIQYVSPSFYYLLGYEPSNLIEKSTEEWLSLLHPDDAPLIKDWLNGLPEQVSLPIICRIRHSRAHYIWMQLMAKILYGQGGHVYNVVLVLRDITLLQESQQFLDAVTNHIDVLLSRFTVDYHCVYVNRFAQNLTIGDGQLQSGKYLKDMNLPQTITEDWQQALETAFNTGEVQELRFTNAGQSVRTRLIPENNTSDDIQFVLCITSQAVD